MNYRSHSFYVLIIFISSTFACSSIKEVISSFVQDAISGIVIEGGVAGIAKAGEAFALEVTDPESELFGAAVFLSQNALPEDVEEALVSIERSELGHLPDKRYGRVGPPVDIRVRRIDREQNTIEDRSITLRDPARVRVPYNRERIQPGAVSDTTVAHVTNSTDSGMELLDNSTVDTSSDTVSGEVLSFSPFVAAQLRSLIRQRFSFKELSSAIPVTVAQKSSADLGLTLERNSDFSGEVSIAVKSQVPGLTGNLINISSGESTGVIVVSASDQVPQGDSSLILTVYGDEAKLAVTLPVFVRGYPGAPVMSFGESGIIVVDFGGPVSDFLNRAIRTSDGGFLVAGEGGNTGVNGVAVKIDADGNFDSSFGTNGRVIHDLTPGADGLFQLVELANGNFRGAGYLTVAGNDLATFGFNSDGSIDSGYGTAGTTFADAGFSNERLVQIREHSNGKFITVGYVNQDCVVQSYNANGSPDTGFNGSGTVTIPQLGGPSGLPECFGLLIMPDGTILLGAGTQNEESAVIYAYQTNGSLESSFGNAGTVNIDLESGGAGYWDLKLDSDGKIVAAGWEGSDKMLVSRFLSDGSIDTSFGNNGHFLSTIANLEEIAFQEDGKIVATGGNDCDPDCKGAVVRLNSDGTLDTGFGVNGITEVSFPGQPDHYSWTGSVLLTDDGRIIVFGGDWNGPNLDDDGVIASFWQ